MITTRLPEYYYALVQFHPLVLLENDEDYAHAKLFYTVLGNGPDHPGLMEYYEALDLIIREYEELRKHIKKMEALDELKQLSLLKSPSGK